MPDKTRIETRIETQRRPVVLPLRGAEVLVAVRGPSPGEGGREKRRGDAGRRGRGCGLARPHRELRPLGAVLAEPTAPLFVLGMAGIGDYRRRSRRKELLLTFGQTDVTR